MSRCCISLNMALACSKHSFSAPLPLVEAETYRHRHLLTQRFYNQNAIGGVRQAVDSDTTLGRRVFACVGGPPKILQAAFEYASLNLCLSNQSSSGTWKRLPNLAAAARMLDLGNAADADVRHVFGTAFPSILSTKSYFASFSFTELG